MYFIMYFKLSISIQLYTTAFYSNRTRVTYNIECQIILVLTPLRLLRSGYNSTAHFGKERTERILDALCHSGLC